ncbi:MAG: hypothetical protein KDA44_21270 [Planctomycetales bacterium]|nr:hypothetical protein [Planctomycetales bacterium]
MTRAKVHRSQGAENRARCPDCGAIRPVGSTQCWLCRSPAAVIGLDESTEQLPSKDSQPAIDGVTKVMVQVIYGLAVILTIAALIIGFYVEPKLGLLTAIVAGPLILFSFFAHELGNENSESDASVDRGDLTEQAEKADSADVNSHGSSRTGDSARARSRPRKPLLTTASIMSQLERIVKVIIVAALICLAAFVAFFVYCIVAIGHATRP